MQTSRDARRDPSATWHATRARILARAGNRCEQCQVANGDDIVRGIEKDVGTFQRLEGDGEVFAADNRTERFSLSWRQRCTKVAILSARLPAERPPTASHNGVASMKPCVPTHRNWMRLSTNGTVGPRRIECGS